MPLASIADKRAGRILEHDPSNSENQNPLFRIMPDHVIDAAGLIGCVLEMRWQQAICARGPAMLKETRRQDCARRHWRPYRGRVLQRQRFRTSGMAESRVAKGL